MVILFYVIFNSYDVLDVYYMVVFNVFEINLIDIEFIFVGNEVLFKGYFDGRYVYFIIDIN